MKRKVRQIQEANISAIMVFLLKDSIQSRQALSDFAGKFYQIGGENIEFCLFEDFLEQVFGEAEKNAFRESMVTFKDEMHHAIGYQVTELCSPYHLQRLREKLDRELKELDYDTIKLRGFAEISAENPNINDLNQRNYGIIKDSYINSGRYKLLLGNADFAESFITSEWLYKKYFALDDLDNTFIVAGYLKSIEQLLWDIIFITGNGRQMDGMYITEENADAIDKTLGSLQHFLNTWSNDDLFQNDFMGAKHFVMGYLNRRISHWRKAYRNGYFHKDNLKKKETIQAIREETCFLYFLILGTLELSSQDMKLLL